MRRTCAFLAALALAACATSNQPPRPDAHYDGGTEEDGGVTTNHLTALEISPASLEVGVGEHGQLEAMGRFSNGAVVDVTSSVAWASDPDNVASVDGFGEVTGLAEGDAVVTASSGGVLGTATLSVVHRAATEMRALWVTRWNYKTAADIEHIFANAARAGFNAVFFQVRGRADAFYASTLEPWGSELTGTLGQDPGFDPLAVAISAGEQRGIEVHAWLNTVPIWSGSAAPIETTPRHVYLEHPEWVMADASGTPMPLGSSGYLCLSPGNPDARDHVLAVVDELVRNYPLDGIHLDYIRYYGSQYSHDAVSEQRFATAQAADPALTWGDWQRDQVTEIVRRAYDLVQGRTGTRLTTAVWHNNDLNVTGSRGYRDYYQDSHAWTEEGIVDALVPMNYFRIDSDPSFAALADDHVAHAYDRQIFMGVHVLGRGGSGEEDPTGTRMLENIEYARSIGADGVALFAYGYLDQYDLWDLLGAGPFAEPAVVPPITWR